MRSRIRSRFDAETADVRAKWRASGIQQRDIAIRLGIKQPTVSNVLTGKMRGKARDRVLALFEGIKGGTMPAQADCPPPLPAPTAPSHASDVAVLPEPKVNGFAIQSHIAAPSKSDLIVDALKALAETAANLCFLRKEIRIAEANYAAMIRKAAAHGIIMGEKL